MVVEVGWEKTRPVSPGGPVFLGENRRGFLLFSQDVGGRIIRGCWSVKRVVLSWVAAPFPGSSPSISEKEKKFSNGP